jgi:hypothetical protein
MEIVMKKFVRVLQCLVLWAVFAEIVIACGSVEHPPAIPLERIPIMDVSSVAGDWEGVLVQYPPSRNEDWIRVRIEEDGTYRYEVLRTIGVFSGQGRFSVEDGALSAKSEKGTINVQLYRHSGKDDRILKNKAQSSDGITYLAELTPKRRSKIE